MADGLGFEPKTALRLYSISSAAPSTGLGHPSAAGKSLPADFPADSRPQAFASVQSNDMSEPNEPDPADTVPFHVPLKL